MQSIKEHINLTLKLAYPVMIGQLGWIMMGVVDTMMVGRLGPTPLASASVSNGIFILILVLGLGVSYAVTPLIAIAIGAGKNEECEILFKQSIIINLLLGIVLMVTTFYLAGIIKFLNQPEEVVRQSISYTRILGYSIIPIMLFQTHKQFIEGLSETRPAMVITIIANIINAAVNWLLVFGNYGFPRLELKGSGWATFSSRLFMAVMMFISVIKSKKFKQFDVSLRIRKINYIFIKKILGLGIPSAFQYFFEVGSFSFAVIMIGWLGTVQLAAHQIAINLASITYMATLGISSAGAIRVGNALGKQDVNEVRRAGFTAIILGASIMAVCGLIFITLRNFLPSLYIHDNNVISIASTLLIIAAMFEIFDGTQAVGIGVLRGLTDVKGPTLIAFISYWVIALPVGYFFGFILKMQVTGVWLGFLVGLASSAILLTLRFNKKSKRLTVY